jgi:hypothetical protein
MTKLRIWAFVIILLTCAQPSALSEESDTTRPKWYTWVEEVILENKEYDVDTENICIHFEWDEAYAIKNLDKKGRFQILWDYKVEEIDEYQTGVRFIINF